MTAFNADNVTMYYSAGACSYQFDYNPSNINYWWEHIQDIIPLGDGTSKFYHRGYLFHSTLEFQQPKFIRGTQYNEFRTIFNTHDNIILNLFTASATGASVNVMWMNDFQFSLVAGATQIGYEGNIVLVGTSVYSSVPSTFTQGNG